MRFPYKHRCSIKQNSWLVTILEKSSHWSEPQRSGLNRQRTTVSSHNIHTQDPHCLVTIDVAPVLLPCHYLGDPIMTNERLRRPNLSRTSDLDDPTSQERASTPSGTETETMNRSGYFGWMKNGCYPSQFDILIDKEVSKNRYSRKKIPRAKVMFIKKACYEMTLEEDWLSKAKLYREQTRRYFEFEAANFTNDFMKHAKSRTI